MRAHDADRILLGRLGEHIAADYLRLKGYCIVERSFRCVSGEIDIIAKDKGVWVFVEVRTKSNDVYGSPLETIDQRKRHKVREVAGYYLAIHRIPDVPVRFDAIGIQLKEACDPFIEFVSDAF